MSIGRKIVFFQFLVIFFKSPFHCLIYQALVSINVSNARKKSKAAENLGYDTAVEKCSFFNLVFSFFNFSMVFVNILWETTIFYTNLWTSSKISKVVIGQWRSFQFSAKLEKYSSCLCLKEISPAKFSRLFFYKNSSNIWEK